MNWKPGHKIYGGGGYVIQRKLGKGGFANAYLARNYHQEPVVIKTIKTEILANPKYDRDLEKLIEDFEREGSRLALFEHPNIVKVKDFFYENSLPCLCMEYIEGQDLGNLIENEGILSEQQALYYIEQIGSALSLIHAQNLLHRDVKPQNIMIRSDLREAILIDFGIAREYLTKGTQNHTQLLSHGFAPLEQYDAKSRKGAYSDVYSTAATLYYMLTAEVPPASFSRIVRDSLIRPQQLNPRISDRLDRAIMIGMVLRPEFRPKSIQQWLRLLQIEIAPQVPSLQLSATSESNDYLRSSDLDDGRGLRNFIPLPTIEDRINSELNDNLFQNRSQQKQKKIIPWFKILKIALFSFPVYLLVAWFLSIYASPNWMWFVSFIGDINLKLFVLEDRSSNKEVAISTWLLWKLTIAIAGVSTFYLVYQATPISEGILGKSLAGIAALLLFSSINLSLLYFLRQNLLIKTKYLSLKKYQVLTLLIAISWLGLMLGWVLWYEH
ncbi:MAG: serine/threonine protein kinase [Prochloraceae cyanobacterium]